jgi:ABC-2 type transport system permease protein
VSVRRIGILFKKEIFQGPRGFIFIWAVIMPIVLSFVLAAVFGNLTSEKPKLGVYDRDSSELTAMLETYDAIKLRVYTSEDDIRDAVASGFVDMGIIIPTGFDVNIENNRPTKIDELIFGESQAKNRAILTVTLSNMIREIADQDAPVEINTVTLGDEAFIPWTVRLLPILMLFAIFLGGIFIPATSLIDEKEKKTMTALIVTPTSVMDVFVAKGLLGFVLGLFVGIIVLAVNNALGSHPLLLILTLVLGGMMAVGLGMIFGAVLKDVTTLFAIWKSSGIVLFGPGIIYMFPMIPQWIGRIFPTYYMLDPLMNITQNGAGWSDIALNVLILVGIDVAIFVIFILVLKRSSQYAV